MDQNAFQRLTPATVMLLQWWFGRGSEPGFHKAQREAILDTILMHESGPRSGRRMHRVTLPTGAAQVPVLLALLVWQLLNRNDALRAGALDARFTHHFLVLAPGLFARCRVYNALCGLPQPGEGAGRDFGTSDLVRLTERWIPQGRRHEVHAFVRAHACSGALALRRPVEDGVIAVIGDPQEAQECLALLPDAMVFDDEMNPLGEVWRKDAEIHLA